jgi:stress response protein YsnF
MREEPVVAKEARVTGKVRLDKTSEVETQTVGGEVRREDVEVDQDVDTYPDSTADTVINGDAS